MVYFQSKNLHFALFLKALEWIIRVYFMVIHCFWINTVYFTSIMYNLWWSGKNIFPLWYVTPRKIWQLWFEGFNTKIGKLVFRSRNKYLCFQNTLQMYVGYSWHCKFCGNNGQGDRVDNLYSKRVKSILTGHKQKHLHLYKINGRSRLGSNSGSDPSTNKNIKQFYVKQKIERSTKRREK
jgi:hypothetical protein